MVMLAVTLLVLAFGGAAFAVAFGSNEASQKRIADIAKAQPGVRAARAAAETQGQRRKSMQQLLKEIEKKQAEKKPTMTLPFGLSQVTANS